MQFENVIKQQLAVASQDLLDPAFDDDAALEFQLEPAVLRAASVSFQSPDRRTEAILVIIAAVARQFLVPVGERGWPSRPQINRLVFVNRSAPR